MISQAKSERAARVCVVIVNWNSGDQLLNCVNSLLSSSSEQFLRIIVVDNASNDDSMNALRQLENVTTIYSKINLGFGRACNLGAQAGDEEFILFLNPDASVYEDTLLHVLEFMDSPAAASVGICGVQLLDGKLQIARSCARLPTPLSFFLQASGLTKLKPFYRYGSRMAEWDHGESKYVDQLIGAFFFVRRNVFEKLKGFDERFFVYFEEVDFSLRAGQLGWKSFYLSTAQAFHSGGGTSDQVKAKRLFYSLRSRILYAFKNFSWHYAFAVLLLTLIFEPMTRSVFAASRFSFKSIKEIFFGYAMLWAWILKKLNLGLEK